MFPGDLDNLRRRVIIGGAAVVSIIYLAVALLKPNEPPNYELLLCSFVGWLFLLIMWLAYP